MEINNIIYKRLGLTLYWNSYRINKKILVLNNILYEIEDMTCKCKNPKCCILIVPTTDRNVSCFKFIGTTSILNDTEHPHIDKHDDGQLFFSSKESYTTWKNTITGTGTYYLT